MAQKQIISMMFLILISTNVIQGTFLPSFVDVLALPQVGQYSHNIASSAANAASSAYNGFKTYITDMQGGFGPNLVIPPEYAFLRRFFGSEPMVGPTIVGQAVDAASSAASAASGNGNLGLLGALGGASSASSASSVAKKLIGL